MDSISDSNDVLKDLLRDGAIGTVVGAERSKGDVSALIKDALASGQAVLVVHARTENETSMAQQVVSLNDSAPMAALQEDVTESTRSALLDR